LISRFHSTHGNCYQQKDPTGDMKAVIT